MRISSITIRICAALTCLLWNPNPLRAQATAFTYQGSLNVGTNAANGTYDLAFSVWDAASGPAQVGSTVTNAATAVSNGRFTVTLDFGNGVFSGANRWLEISVRTNGSGAFNALTPRQPVTPTPYAIYAANAAALNGLSAANFAPASGSSVYVAKSGDTMTGTLNLPANGLVAGGNQLVLSGGSVGIGTANPTTKLHVFDSGGANVLIGGGSSAVTDRLTLFTTEYGIQRPANQGTLQFDSAGRFVWAVSGSEKMRMDSSGNVGIGTAAPQERLHVAGNAVVSAPHQFIAQYQNNNNDYSASLGWNSLQLGNNGVNYIIAGRTLPGSALVFVTDNTNDFHEFNIPHNGKEVMTLTAGGNVGIGTTSPQTDLHVVGSIMAEGTGGNGRIIMRGTAVGGHQYEWYPDDPAPGDLGLYDRTAGAYGFVVKANGNVGIGTTAPQEKLQVSGGNVLIDENRFLLAGNQQLIRSRGMGYSPAGYPGVQIGQTGSHIALFLDPGTVSGGAFDGNQNEIMLPNFIRIHQVNNAGTDWIDSMTFANGNVGIGTTDPATSLHVAANHPANPIAIFKQTNPANLARLVIDSPTDDASRPALITLRRAGVDRWSVGGIYGSDSFGIGSDSTVPNQKVVVTPSGSVGIGTTTPTTKLEVAGSVKVTGAGNSITTPVLSITGGADVAEPFLMSTPDVPKGAVVIIDDEHPGRVKLSERAYDQRVAGIVSGANGVQPGLTLSQQGVLDGGENVALSGRVYALADAGNAPIKPGDLLTTSAVPGHAMKVTDHAKAQGAIIGKAMSALPQGRGYVLVLVTLQ